MKMSAPNTRRQVLYAAVLAGAFAVIGCATASPTTDFFSAIRSDNASGVSRMLRAGFDPNVKDEKGEGGLNLAIKEPSPRSLKVLLDWPGTKAEVRNASDESPLMMAAIKGQVDTVKALIAKDGDVNKTGWTPLHYAVSAGGPQQLEIVRVLLDASAYIDAESPNKTTPLMMAARYGSEQAVKLLFEEGADPTLRNEQGLTAADFARKAEREELAAQLDKVAATWRKPAASAPAAAAGAVKKSW
ncbi:ankyrin repeat domain-containing protein [Xylophilus sp. GOD-11R]|uniref:ankyrin repeat domain-containing protein n=1 Tax=Xylophilus sp. GOD-11R TaxID=3089814 RepID=UPI00298C1421|nr:ankyrin repeat domain-containing protein [Xylophilus sp. GOD-11R]WPB59235.1 ankyrin repeat domain-containing protein [Xylophilus sp. GOD-11R]